MTKATADSPKDTLHESDEYGEVIGGDTVDGPRVFLYRTRTELTLRGALQLAIVLLGEVAARSAAQ
jgi:hypothetical protein